ncbi:hypothetical protein [Streptomyces scabiei]|uniref:hypothetical protein n=1 Tax=Streptomyces scabiei TaxID=1930 RepID=UPI001902572C|nr:hypothetical protein [Streptomyces scabiei]
MRRSRTGRPAAIYAVLQVVAVGLALWLSKHFEVARLSATMIALAPTLPAACLAWFAYRDDRREAAADTDATVKRLAAVVAAAETRQRAQLIGPGAHRIDVTFRQRTEPANNATGAAAHGSLTNIVSYYQDLSPARLAITGEPGAGKTLLALDLILGLLTHPGRTDTDPVPVSTRTWPAWTCGCVRPPASSSTPSPQTAGRALTALTRRVASRARSVGSAATTWSRPRRHQPGRSQRPGRRLGLRFPRDAGVDDRGSDGLHERNIDHGCSQKILARIA